MINFFTGSDDGLINVFNYTISGDEDDAYHTGINIEKGISKIGFFGNQGKFLFCTTQMETLSLCDLENESNQINFGSNFRDQLSQCSSLQIHCLIDLKFTAKSELLLFGGTLE